MPDIDDLNGRRVTSLSASLPSLRLVRERITHFLATDAARRDVVVLAVDGIGHDMAVGCWRQAEIEPMCSVFPTTSSAAWLSSLTGASVADHGVPGVVFTIPGADRAPRNVYGYTGGGLGPQRANLFSDAAAMRYQPLTVPADLEAFPGAWLDMLLAHSRRLPGHRFYAAGGPCYRTPDIAVLRRKVAAAVREGRLAADGPMLLWVFVEADRHVHRHGYDEHVTGLLTLLDQFGASLADAGTVVFGYADHGQVPTRHDPEIAGLLDHLTADHGCKIGGAGRVRWLYPAIGQHEAVAAALARRLPATVTVEPGDAVFPPGSPARGRVGDLVLTATGPDFLAPGEYQFEHGSRTEAELVVPFARWSR
jgi:hypothetical protein